MGQSSDVSKNVNSAGRCVTHSVGDAAASDCNKTDLEHIESTMLFKILFLREQLGSNVVGYTVVQTEVSHNHLHFLAESMCQYKAI